MRPAIKRNIMSKYIDAEKLTRFEEILADIIVSSQGLCTYEACKDVAKSEAPFLIASLQQEQPDEQPEYGPYARQYPKSKVSHEQPEVDLSE